MASIQRMIVKRVQLYIYNEIKKYLRLQRDEIRKIQRELTECKKRLSQLEKNMEGTNQEAIARWIERLRTNGTTVKTFRKKLALSQTEFAILLDTNPATVNRWESGKVRLSRKSCEKITRIRSMSQSEVRQTLNVKNIPVVSVKQEN